MPWSNEKKHLRRQPIDKKTLRLSNMQKKILKGNNANKPHTKMSTKNKKISYETIMKHKENALLDYMKKEEGSDIICEEEKESTKEPVKEQQTPSKNNQ